MRLEPENVRAIAMEILRDCDPWDYGGVDDVSYLKSAMYNAGVIDMADRIITAIQELKKA